ALQTVAVLEMPVARRLAIQKVAAEPGPRALERRRSPVIAAFHRAPCGNDLTLELRRIELRDHRGVHPVSVVHEHDPIRVPQRLPQSMKRHVEAVPELRLRRLRPERE